MSLGTEKEMWDVWREYTLRLLSGNSVETLKKEIGAVVRGMGKKVTGEIYMLEGRWQDRYLVYAHDCLLGDQEEELEMLETLIHDTEKVGEAAVRCLERMRWDEMDKAVGIILLLVEYRGMQKNE